MSLPAAARVAADALGMTPRNYGHLVMMAARYARLRLDGHSVVNRQTGALIGLDWERGLKNATAPGMPSALLLAVPALPAMLAQARYRGALAPRPPYPPHVLRYHAFAAKAEIGGRRVDVILIVQEDRQHRLYLDRVLSGEALPHRDVGGANPNAPSSTMAPADDVAKADGPAAPVSATAAPSAGDNATSAPPPSPQGEGWFHSLLASVGLADSGGEGPPAPAAPSDIQKPVDYPPPPPPKPEFRRVPDFDEQGFPNYLPGDPYPRYEPTRPPPEPNMAERVFDAAAEGAKEGWGPGRLGFSPESEQWLQDTGQFNKPGETNPIRTLNEAWMKPLAAGADAILRGGSALFRGAQAAGVAAGLPRDIVAMPEAFFGSPDPVGMPRAPAQVSPPEMALRDIAESMPAEAPRPNEGPPPPDGEGPPSAVTAGPEPATPSLEPPQEPATTPGAGNAETTQPTLQTPGGKGSGPLSFHDRLDDLERFREEKGLDGTNPSDHNDAARQYVIQRQGDKKAEHVAIYDGNANAITHAGTSLDKGQVAIPADVDAKLRDPAEKITIHHSHPDSGGLSPDDLQLTPRPGTAWVVAHDTGGELSAARLTPEARTALRCDNELGQKRAQNTITDLWERADRASRRAINQAVDRGEFTREEADRISTEIVNRALADAGVIEYVTSHSLPSHPVIDRMRALANSAMQTNIRSKIPELANHVPDSPTKAMGVHEGMARISGQDDGAAAGRPGRARGGPSGTGRAGSAQRQGDGGRHRSSLPGPARRELQAAAGTSGRRAQGEARRIGTIIPRVTGYELETAPTSYGHLVMLTARYARARLDGRSVINREMHAPIALMWQRGIDQIAVPGRPAEMLLAVPAIPEMLAGARYLGSAPDPQRRPDVSRVHGFASAVEIGGRRLDVLMVVRENRQGRLVLDGMESDAAPGARAA
jgi:hypothetical protein